MYNVHDVCRIAPMNTAHTTTAAAVATFLPSPQQSDFFDWVVNGQGSCVLEAVAGAGKTTTLVKAVEMMDGKVFFGAFSKDIVAEIRTKVSHMGNKVTVNTMHAEGFGALRRAFSKIKVDGGKCTAIYRAASEKYPEYKPFENPVIRLVSLAKQHAVGITKDMKDRRVWLEIIDHYDIETFSENDVDGNSVDNTDLVIKLARKVLEHSNASLHEVADFDDMIYGPLFHKVKFFQYDWVLIDEAQDTNEARRLLALAILKRGGRMVAVGDRHQAIFGFTGADSNSLELIAQSVNAKRLPLNVTYRCPKSVVTYAQTWVNHIQAAETAPEGVVSSNVSTELAKIAKPGDAILCRFNAPLVRYVYSFIAEGIPALIEGRDIADGLMTLARRWKRISSYAAMLEKLDAYQERETAKYRIKEQESKAAAVEDKVGCLRVIIARAEKIDPTAKNIVQRIVAEIEAIFAKGQDGTVDKSKVVLFSSGHKSKGREWKKVVWLQTGPSPWARKEWEIEQENNLCYVMATRAKEELCLVDISAEMKK